MGIFQSIYSMGPQGHRLRKKKFRLMRAQAWNQIHSASEAQLTDLEETERGRAFLGQNLAGRGLSKSSIADQDTDRFNRLADRRAAANQRRVELAWLNRKHVLQAIKYERKSVYAAMIDGIISIAAGAGSGGTSAQSSFSGINGGEYSSQDYYGFTPGQG